MTDEIFANPRLAAIYDAQDGERDDLETYMDFARSCNAASVLDIGCGTGSLAVLLAEKGIDVVGVDPAAASLDVARSKPFADRVTWIHGFAHDVPSRQFDLATMTGNVAQAIHDPAEWMSTLTTVYSRLRLGGHFIFESRIPSKKAWLHWNKEESHLSTSINGIGRVESWDELLSVDGPLVTFRRTWIFEDGDVLTSNSTLRFREKEELADALAAAGFAVDDVRDAPDRPGAEYVFVARRV
jgi:SAM-dependent methyltransferase